MAQNRYRCKNSGALCAFARDGRAVTFGETEPPCGVAECHAGADWLEAWPPWRFPLSRGAVAAGTAALVLLVAAGTAYFYFRRDVAGADKLITEFYPDLPPAVEAGK